MDMVSDRIQYKYHVHGIIPDNTWRSGSMSLWKDESEPLCRTVVGGSSRAQSDMWDDDTYVILPNKNCTSIN